MAITTTTIPRATTFRRVPEGELRRLLDASRQLTDASERLSDIAKDVVDEHTRARILRELDTILDTVFVINAAVRAAA